MNGCSSEYVMGVVKSSSTDYVPFWGTYCGFNTNNTPLFKYFDLYEYGNSNTDFNRKILGDATGETNGWYGGRKVFSTYYTEKGSVFLRSSFEFNINMRNNTASSIGSRSVIVLP